VTEPTPPRDAQRSRVYRAETPLRGRRLPELAHCAGYACEVVGSRWWTDRFPEHGLDAVPTLRPGYGARHAFYREDPEGPTITLPRRYRTTSVLLHELAHWGLRDAHDLPNHGRTFTRLLLDLFTEFAGDDRGVRLAAGYEEHRVHVGRRARIGPDGRWCYAWDERLRRGRDRALAVGHSPTAGGALVTRGVLTSRAHATVHLHSPEGDHRIPERTIWSVTPA